MNNFVPARNIAETETLRPDQSLMSDTSYMYRITNRVILVTNSRIMRQVATDATFGRGYMGKNIADALSGCTANTIKIVPS